MRKEKKHCKKKAVNKREQGSVRKEAREAEWKGRFAYNRICDFHLRVEHQSESSSSM